MKMFSNLCYVSVACLLICSCSNDKDLYNPEQEYTAKQLAVINAHFENFNTTTTEAIDVPTGKYVVVRIGNDTLCVATESQSVVVPKGCTTIKDVYNLPASTKTDVDFFNPLNSSKDKYAKEKFWQVIAFEDTKNGDYDYNDLIVHVRYQLTNNNQFSLFIHPIAYGASKTINLFYEVYNTSDNSLIKKDSVMDVKANLFLDHSNKGFINSYAYKRHYDGYTVAMKDVPTSVNKLSNIAVVWYITTGNDSKTKIYALSKTLLTKVDLFNTNGYPYSLVLSGVNPDGYPLGVKEKCGFDWFRFPLESIDIRKCYDMDKWQSNNGTGNGVALEKYMYDNAQVINVLTKESESQKSIYDIPAPIKQVTSWTGE